MQPHHFKLLFIDKVISNSISAESFLLKLGFKIRSPGSSHFIFWKEGYEKNLSLKKRPKLLPYQMDLLEEVLKSHEQDKIKGLIACAVEIYKEKGEPVPEPIDKEHYKGKILYRTNSERHYLIARTAKIMHKSISKTLDILIDKGLENPRENQRAS